MKKKERKRKKKVTWWLEKNIYIYINLCGRKVCEKGIKKRKNKNEKLDSSIFIGQNVFIHKAKLNRMREKSYFYQMNLSNEKRVMLL